ncbi:NAD(P)H-binding protein [Desertivirga arenae]|uniref:NAD(P)H-binding protein n=1 Tax=Desertivirga arenae TaxID=2810309 RepID=UPI001A9709C7|nr:NAD(P)H-binding protein [Pedobacter sp. SYSU D00823]
MKKAVITGATGLVGSLLLQLLLDTDAFEEVLVLTRRPAAFKHPKLRQVVINFDDLEQHREEIKGDVLYFCLGTTKRKTPNREDYKKIEHSYCLKLSRIAKDNNIAQFHYISALGADSRSRLFYSKLKGKTEEDLKKYIVRSLHIYRPSLLRGKRNEFRILEKLFTGFMVTIDPLLIGDLKKYQSIEAIIVAKAMLNQTLKELEGIHIYPSDKIKELA